ncbi:gamma-glutamyltransferase family protein [Sphingobium baderi]|uniref:gamma-glutamyltransferase family protein n=1 Tax=Sphingobium baderi TaxID=1332080 RepID=UPI002B408816|nr:gamma-glutamyltransferase family protein [Sphingobium baderi]WRD77068.1 gamma-glutamyltransferase family protein [Sphingobium baderi]
MQHSLRGYRGVTTAPHHLASQAGLDILKDGGTAVEACVAMAAALAVVYPHMTGIGGDGFWLIHDPDGHVHAVDACGAAAGKADLSFYGNLTEIPWRGPLAANTVAGTISGWQQALAGDAGTLTLTRLLRDAIELAEEGVAVTRGGAEVGQSKHAELVAQRGAYRDVFTVSGRPLQENDRLKQPALAQTLKTLAENGFQDFYSGCLARAIVGDLADLGSPLTAEDLARHRASEPAPLSVRVNGATLFNTAPPTQGLASLLILALFDRLDVGAAETFGHLHGLVEATKQAFLIRDAHVGDPAYMEMSPQDLLDDPDRLDALAAAIDPARAMPWPWPSALGDTTWFGAADMRGQVVSCIQSTYFEFGSGLVLPETGITWQNRGSSFRLTADGWNALQPGRKPFHTLNPALARFEDGRVMGYGTMGGEGQPQTQAAIFSRYARFGVPLQEAVSRPRWLLGRTWGETSMTLKLESRFSPELVDKLRAAGHDVELLSALTSTMGHAGAIVRHPDAMLEGATDPRSDGAVAAW